MGIKNPRHLSQAEHTAILDLCRRCNMAVYAAPTGENPDKAIIRDLGRQFGLEQLDHNPGADEDAVTSLTVQSDAYHKGYIPYTDRPIAWHTDGYYNSPDRQIHALLLHQPGPWHFKGRLEVGQGLISNNVLHTRTRFKDGGRPRKLYRARYYERIAGT